MSRIDVQRIVLGINYAKSRIERKLGSWLRVSFKELISYLSVELQAWESRLDKFEVKLNVRIYGLCLMGSHLCDCILHLVFSSHLESKCEDI